MLTAFAAEWCLPANEREEKTGGGEDSAVASNLSVAARLFPFLFPSALHHSARRASVERNLLLARAQSCVERNLPPARETQKPLPQTVKEESFIQSTFLQESAL